MKKAVVIGHWWHNPDITLIRIEESGAVFALDGWNGEDFTNCWQVTNAYDASIEKYTIRPHFEGVLDSQNDDGSFEQYTTIGYEFIW